MNRTRRGEEQKTTCANLILSSTGPVMRVTMAPLSPAAIPMNLGTEGAGTNRMMGQERLDRTYLPSEHLMTAQIQEQVLFMYYLKIRSKNVGGVKTGTMRRSEEPGRLRMHLSHLSQFRSRHSLPLSEVTDGT